MEKLVIYKAAITCGFFVLMLNYEMVLKPSPSIMLKVRLQRIGKRNQAYFRVVVVEHTTKPKGRYLELLGSYDPHKDVINVKGERIKYWITKGAQLSDTVNNLLVERKVIDGKKVKVWKAKKKEQKVVPEASTMPIQPAEVKEKKEPEAAPATELTANP